MPGRADKEALLQSGPPWFTTPHFDGYAYVLVRERDLHLLDEVELVNGDPGLTGHGPEYPMGVCWLPWT